MGVNEVTHISEEDQAAKEDAFGKAFSRFARNKFTGGCLDYKSLVLMYIELLSYDREDGIGGMAIEAGCPAFIVQ